MDPAQQERPNSTLSYDAARDRTCSANIARSIRVKRAWQGPRPGAWLAAPGPIRANVERGRSWASSRHAAGAYGVPQALMARYGPLRRPRPAYKNHSDPYFA